MRQCAHRPEHALWQHTTRPHCTPHFNWVHGSRTTRRSSREEQPSIRKTIINTPRTHNTCAFVAQPSNRITQCHCGAHKLAIATTHRDTKPLATHPDTQHAGRGHLGTVTIGLGRMWYPHMFTRSFFVLRLRLSQPKGPHTARKPPWALVSSPRDHSTRSTFHLPVSSPLVAPKPKVFHSR